MSNDIASKERGIVDRLREGATVLDEPFHRTAIEMTMLDAADEIENLRCLCARVVAWRPPFPVEASLLDDLGRAASEVGERL